MFQVFASSSLLDMLKIWGPYPSSSHSFSHLLFFHILSVRTASEEGMPFFFCLITYFCCIRQQRRQLIVFLILNGDNQTAWGTAIKLDGMKTTHAERSKAPQCPRSVKQDRIPVKKGVCVFFLLPGAITFTSTTLYKKPAVQKRRLHL